MTTLLLALAVAVPTAAAANGRSLYAENCLSCHGVAGQGVLSPSHARGVLGVRGLGPSLRGVGALSADFYLRTGYMPLIRPDVQPSRKRSPYSEAQIEALVSYVASLGGGPAIPTPHPERGSLSDGLSLFTASCAGCHQVVAEGGYVTDARVPPLEHDSPVRIAEAVRTGPYLMPRFSRTQISDRELNSIVAYVQGAKHPDDRGGWGLGHIGPVPEGLVTWFIAAVALVAICILIGGREKT